jgi:hypothetical protein
MSPYPKAAQHRTRVTDATISYSYTTEISWAKDQYCLCFWKGNEEPKQCKRFLSFSKFALFAYKHDMHENLQSWNSRSPYHNVHLKLQKTADETGGRLLSAIGSAYMWNLSVFPTADL